MLEVTEKVLAGLVVSILLMLVQFTIQWIRGRTQEQQPAQESYSDQVAKLTGLLSQASAEVDRVLRELAEVATERERSLRELEHELGALGKQEQELKEKIEILKDVPVPVAEQFNRLLAPSERRSAWRDYFLFGAGVVVSTLITLALGALGIS